MTKNEIEKIKKGLFLDSYMLSQNALFYNKTNSRELEKDENLNRKLSEDELTLKDVGFFAYQIGKPKYSIRSYTNIFNNINKDKSKYILYPYSFTYKKKLENGNIEEREQNKGGFFALNQNILPDESYFQNIKNITSVEISKSKALYDVDIGILTYETIIDNNQINLFSEADYFCSFFVQRLTKVEECARKLDELKKFRKDHANKGGILLISPEILKSDEFQFKKNGNNFGLLIIPDHVFQTEDKIIEAFGEEGKKKIKDFVDDGGHILATGKSGYLLEKLEIISSGLYQTKKYLYYFNNNKETDKSQVSLTGCEGIPSKKYSEQNDFFKQVMCMNFQNKIYLTSTYAMNIAKMEETGELSTIMSIASDDIGSYLKFKLEDGNDEQIGTNDDFPIVLTKQEERKGRITIINGNLLVNTDYTFQLIMDLLFYSMGKNVIFDAFIKYSDGTDEDLPIPGGEEGVRLSCFFKFFNLFESPLNEITIDIFTALKTQFITIPEGCEIKENDNTKYINITDMDNSHYMHCNLAQLNKFSDFSKEMTIEITDQSVTQKETAIPIFHPFLEYKDPESNEKMFLDHGAVEATAALSAILRVTANCDPPGDYPVWGEGNFFDQILNVENKENTIAKNVNLITIIPVISLIVADLQENSIIHTLEFYDEYYKKHNYTFPWNVTGGEYDFIDYAELSNKKVVFSDDFDEPVKRFQVESTELKESGEVQNLYEVDGMLKVDVEDGSTPNINNQLLLKEMCYKDSDVFYEVADTRKLVFIDTSYTKGAQAYYNNNIPEEEQDPADPTRAKINVVFTRVDLYFKDDPNYQKPKNIADDMVFTTDKYEPEPTIKVDKEIGKYTANISLHKNFNSGLNDGKLIPFEFYNVLKQHTNIKKFIDPLASGYNITEDYPNMKLSHYLIHIKGNRISRAGSIKDFVEDQTDNEFKSGYLRQYPSVKFIFAHRITFAIDKSLSRLGGKLVINLSNCEFQNNKLPSENDFVTLSVDGVAVYKIEYDYVKGEKNIIIAYFKRGLMPDEISGKDSNIELNIENLTTTENITATIELYDLKYDLSKRESNFEDYVKVESFKTEHILSYQKFWSLPCLIIENKFERNESSIIAEYELLDPYARYTLYYQELLKHRAVYCNSLSSQFSQPGLQTPYSSYDLISNIGIVSIPFADYLSHSALIIPAASSTSRIEWEDVWGRHWAQPIRTVMPNFLPLPYVSQSFMMITTYEIIQNGNRVLEWESSDPAYIMVHIKFLNNYWKYLNLAICKDNQIIIGNSETDNVTINHSHVYGKCYQTTNAFLSGKRINDSVIDKMTDAMICADTGDAAQMEACAKHLKELNLPLLVRRNSSIKLNEGEKWNYSPLVENYYPKGYIDEDIMWEMTKTNYASDSYRKGYPFHFDNNLPGLEDEFSFKPVNLMAFPIFKGFGYKIDYSNKNSVPNRYNGGKGWWSDNLQNKDSTLLAGQTISNTYPTINKTLLSEKDWINAKLINSDKIQKRLKSKYVCKYNQHRIRVNPRTNTKLVTFSNIFQNNIIPVEPDMNDSDVNNFDCTNEYQYSPTNISEVDNRVKTNNDRDWLYFAANLRAEGRETLNIILTLDPFSDRKYEGETKIQDGGRFTYWNPALAQNAYLYLDNNVNVVRSFRVDLTCNVAVYPSRLNTFKAVNYHLFTLEDPKEEMREYKTSIYTNSYGFGDSVVTVYVGGTEKSDCRIRPGETTFVKITFFNNAGFDWNMKGGAIIKDDLSIPSDKLMKDKIHSVQVPKEYRFLQLEIPEPIRNYVEIIPSDHNKDVLPQFFDFECINVVTIRDGFKGEYYYKLKLLEGLDEKYFGRFWDIKVNLRYDCFDMLPGSPNDPVTKVKSGVTMLHDYTLKVPPIRFGIPYPSNHPNPEYRNKVFYTLGRASNITISYNIYEEFSLDDIKIVSQDEVERIMEASASETNVNEDLLDIWNNGIANTSSYLTGEINAKILEPVSGYKRIYIFLNKSFPELPYEVYGQTDVTKIYILAKVSAPQVTYGSRLILKWGYGKYNDSRILKNTNTGLSRYISAYGPWMKMDIEKTLMDYNEETKEFTEKTDQTHYGYNGYMKLKITAINAGSNDAYQTSYKYIFSNYVQIVNNFGDNSDIVKIVKNETSGESNLYFNSQRQIPQNTKDVYNVYVKFDFGEEEDNSKTIRRHLKNDDEKVILKSADVTLCQNVECNDDNSFVNQLIDINFKMSMSNIEEENIENKKPKEITLQKDAEKEKENEEKENEPKEESNSKSKAWIAALIVASVFVIGLVIYLLLDYKKKLWIFKNRKTDISPADIVEKNAKNENSENMEKIYTVKKKRSIKNYANSSTFASNRQNLKNN